MGLLGRRRGEDKGAGIEAERPLRAPLAMVLVGHCFAAQQKLTLIARLGAALKRDNQARA